ncbi:unnamed protein product, partial [Brenthis ino]
MDSNYCRGCLTKYEPVDLFPYTEKSRRLFVYSTGLQVKRNDAFLFQLCKECCINMKVACNFKKTCRNSDKKLKSYLQSKESGDNTDLGIFLKNNEDTFKLRLPINIGNSTPAYHINKDDDNESTCTSIQNFMTDILQAEEIPDSEARIICEVIEEEADILEDSLDSHWLQEDVSVDSDFKMDFSFSPFSTPHSVNNGTFYCPKKFNDLTQDDKKNKVLDVNLETINENTTYFNKPVIEFNLNEILKKEIHLTKDIEENKCVIDANLENALKNDTAEKVMLDDILLTPPVLPNISGPPTPEIANILFGDKINEKSIVSQEIVNSKNNVCQEDIDVLDEFLKVNNSKRKSVDIDFDDSLIDMEEIENIQNYFNKNSPKKDKNIEVKDIKRPTSPIENKYCITNFYCKMCKRQFKNLVALKVHCTKHHKFKIEKPKTKRIRKKYICDYCGQLFTSSRCIAKHLANHQNPSTYKCEKCTLKFSSEATYRKHLSVHTGIRTKKVNGKNYVCNTCGAVCSNSSNFNIHIRRHSNKYTHNCEVCGKGFYRTSDLTLHMRYHTGEKPYACHLCPRRFTRQDSLCRHIKCHTGEKPFSCQFCDSKFCKSYDLKVHQKNSKKCLEQQKLIVEESTEDIMQKILITEALVF